MKDLASGKTDKFSFSFKLSDDRLKLFLDASPVKMPESEEFPKIEPDDLYKVLPTALVHDFLHKDVLIEICKELSEGKNISERRVAKGRIAEDGKDGRVVIMTRRMTKKAELLSDEQGFVDFKDLHLFENIRIGSLVAKIFAPSAGKQGTDPLGKTIQARSGKAAKVSFDSSSIKAEIQKDSDVQDLYALKDGYLLDESGKLSIQEELNISSSVDYKTGSIDFIGNIKIKGDVSPGFIVRGRKGVFISGSVNEATITSSEGSVEIKGFLSGGISSKIEAKADVILSVAQQAEVFAGRSIRVTKEARNCSFHCSGLIDADKALIISGIYACACGLEAKEIGSKLAAQIVIQMSSNIAATEEYINLEAKITQHEKALSILTAHLGPLATTNAGFNLLTEKHKQKLQPLIEKKNIISNSLIELKALKESILSKAVINAKFRINAKSKFYPGLKIRVLDNIFEVKDQIDGPKTIEFDFDKNEFLERDYTAIECQIINGEKNE